MQAPNGDVARIDGHQMCGMRAMQSGALLFSCFIVGGRLVLVQLLSFAWVAVVSLLLACVTAGVATHLMVLLLFVADTWFGGDVQAAGADGGRKGGGQGGTSHFDTPASQEQLDQFEADTGRRLPPGTTVRQFGSELFLAWLGLGVWLAWWRGVALGW